MPDTVAIGSVLYTTSRLRFETFRQFLWWAGYRHNLKAMEFIASSIQESPGSVFARNFFLCEHHYRYVYEHETRRH